MSDYWSGKRVVVDGASGFLGTPLCLALEQHGAKVIRWTSEMFDLRNKIALAQEFAIRMYSKPVDVLFHLAADVGGIGDNISRPAELFYNNVMLNTNVVEAAHHYGVKKVIALGSSCAYPHDAPLPLVESDYLRGEPEPTNASYAYSKRLLLSHLQAAHTQYGLNYTYLILANLYGEGCDTDPRTAHVIGALVRKFYEARRDGDASATLWGTGEATRDFLHVDDAVYALIRAGEHAGYSNLTLNIGSGVGWSIKEIAHIIAFHTGYMGEIRWDAEKPDGQAKRVLDASAANILIAWNKRIGLYEGLERTVQWYAATQERVHA